MAIVFRVLISIVAGVTFYALLLFAAFRFISLWPPRVVSVLLWNASLFQSWGRGEPVGYMPDGAPVYDGMIGVLGQTWESILTGFVIYPILFFIGLTGLKKIRKQ
jgi:hypothetical protein